jgi:biotin synthase
MENSMIAKKTKLELLEHVEQTLPSPEYVRISFAAAITIGLKTGQMYRNATCDCVNLLLNYPEGCYANCTYCGLARERPGLAQDNTFIRVGWPVFLTDLVADKIAEHEEKIGRVCIAQVQDKRAYPDLLDISQRIRRKSDVPISALVSATLLDEEKLARIKDAGADIIGVGLDAASEELFYQTRGRGARGPHSWHQHWEVMRIARRLYGPFKVNAHVIVGLGESDRDLVELFYRLKSEEIAAYLFSFNPEPGTEMADVPRAPISRLRRIQLTKHLIEKKGLPSEAIEFDEDGAIWRVHAPHSFIESCIDEGTPFMSNGCPDKNGKVACNRPFGSYRPGEAFRDYPFQPEVDDLHVIRGQMRVNEILEPFQPSEERRALAS